MSASPPNLPASLALGSNRGDRHAALALAFHHLALLPSTKLLARSDLFETAPVISAPDLGTIGPAGQSPYLNAAALLETSLPPLELLNHLHRIEALAGLNRATKQPWGPRELDLDLLTLGDLILNTRDLILPHPRLHQRRFVLEPLAQIAPDLRIPTLNATVRQLLLRLPPEP